MCIPLSVARRLVQRPLVAPLAASPSRAGWLPFETGRGQGLKHAMNHILPPLHYQSSTEMLKNSIVIQTTCTYLFDFQYLIAQYVTNTE